MPSAVHTTIVELLEAHPEALSYLLALEGTAPAGRLLPTTGTRSKTFTLERRVDRAYLVGSRESPRGFMLGEVQMDIDVDKRFSWALYVELARSRYRCEGALVVLTFDAAVRRWIERDIAAPTGQNGSLRRLRPRVLAIDEIPRELLLRKEMPYLAPLAVAGHLGTPEVKEIAERAMDLTAACLPRHLAQEQLDGILGMVDAALRAHLESRAMKQRKLKYASAFLRKLKNAILEDSRAAGLAKGLAKGEARGLAKGKAQSVLQILALRKIPVPAKIRQQVLRCMDLEMLDRWVAAAMVAETAAAAVSDEAAPAPARARRVQRTAGPTKASAGASRGKADRPGKATSASRTHRKTGSSQSAPRTVTRSR